MSSERTPVITLPPGRESFYPSEVMTLLSVNDKTLRGYADDGVLIAINISRAGARPVYRYTRASIEAFIQALNTRDNPQQTETK